MPSRIQSPRSAEKFGEDNMRNLAGVVRRAICAGAMISACIAIAAGAEVPKFEVDPFWPKPLPNNWTLGQVAGVAVDQRDHVWIMQRPRSLSRLAAAAAPYPPRAPRCT